jgi:hypothetical protein
VRLEQLSLDELIKEQKSILHSCKTWEDCTDGSHGLALSNTLYSKVTEEINRRITSEPNTQST